MASIRLLEVVEGDGVVKLSPGMWLMRMKGGSYQVLKVLTKLKTFKGSKYFKIEIQE